MSRTVRVIVQANSSWRFSCTTFSFTSETWLTSYWQIAIIKVISNTLHTDYSLQTSLFTVWTNQLSMGLFLLYFICTHVWMYQLLMFNPAFGCQTSINLYVCKVQCVCVWCSWMKNCCRYSMLMSPQMVSVSHQRLSYCISVLHIVTSVMMSWPHLMLSGLKRWVLFLTTAQFQQLTWDAVIKLLV